MNGTKADLCDDEGNCTCTDNYDGQKCDKCKERYGGFPQCVETFENLGEVKIPEKNGTMRVFNEWGMKFKIEFDLTISMDGGPLDLFAFWAWEGKSSLSSLRVRQRRGPRGTTGCPNNNWVFLKGALLLQKNIQF